VARAFAREGARVFLTGRTLDPIEAVAGDIAAAGGHADTAVVDATDQAGVDAHFASVVDQAGGVDISFNMIGLPAVQGKELAALPLEEYLRPIDVAARAQFITTTVAARQHDGARSRPHHGDHRHAPTARLAAGWWLRRRLHCDRGMLRTLAAEVGPKGVRVCWLRSAGSPEIFGPGPTEHDRERGISDTDYLETLRRDTLLRRFPRLTEVGEAAILLASNYASAMTGATANITCGQIVD
jgi:3-oxoacyl-[acyl-carrier protein] reductase